MAVICTLVVAPSYYYIHAQFSFIGPELNSDISRIVGAIYPFFGHGMCNFIYSIVSGVL